MRLASDGALRGPILSFPGRPGLAVSSPMNTPTHLGGSGAPATPASLAWRWRDLGSRTKGAVAPTRCAASTSERIARRRELVRCRPRELLLLRPNGDQRLQALRKAVLRRARQRDLLRCLSATVQCAAIVQPLSRRAAGHADRHRGCGVPAGAATRRVEGVAAGRRRQDDRHTIDRRIATDGRGEDAAVDGRRAFAHAGVFDDTGRRRNACARSNTGRGTDAPCGPNGKSVRQTRDRVRRHAVRHRESESASGR